MNTNMRKCPYCGSESKIMDSAIIYNGLSYGNALVCVNYPKCDSYVGCHKGTETPLGIMANAELREWKKKAYNAFDPYWKNKTMSRSKAYKILAEKLNIDSSDCHIGLFDVEMCKRVIWICEGGL